KAQGLLFGARALLLFLRERSLHFESAGARRGGFLAKRRKLFGVRAKPIGLALAALSFQGEQPPSFFRVLECLGQAPLCGVLGFERVSAFALRLRAGFGRGEERSLSGALGGAIGAIDGRSRRCSGKRNGNVACLLGSVLVGGLGGGC